MQRDIYSFLRSRFFGPEPKVFIEVGAYDGADTRRLANFPGVTVHSFEPSPDNELVKLPNVMATRAAVSDRYGTATFHASVGADGSKASHSGSLLAPGLHLTTYPHIAFPETVEVTTVKLDGYAATLGIGKVDFIWMDVQGAEGLVIKGATELLKRTRFLYTEYAEPPLYGGQPSLKEFKALLGPGWRVLKNYGVPMAPFGDVLFENLALHEDRPVGFCWERLGESERRVHSQNGEDGLIARLFKEIETTNRYLVDLGAGAINGQPLSNTQLLLEQGWTGTRIDGEGGHLAHKEWITQENIIALLSKYDVPSTFDFLSLDLDGNDFYILRAVLRGGYRPRAFVVEANAESPWDPPRTIIYNPEHRFDNSDYYGASLGAFRRLAENYGYTLVYLHAGFNAFFVQSELLAPGCKPHIWYEDASAWPRDPLDRPWVLLGDEALR